MTEPGTTFATALAERLDAVVPRPMRVRAEGGVVAIYEGPECWGGTGPMDVTEEVVPEDEEPPPLGERIETAARALLSGMQDCVARALAVEWPVLRGGGMALPDVRWDGERLHLWFGLDEATAVLTLPPIPRHEIL